MYENMIRLVQPAREPTAGAAGAQSSIDFLSQNAVRPVLRFHQSFPAYSETPLAQMGSLARELGIAGLYVKDESHRFGLNAFKVLGGSYAIGKCLAKRLGADISELPYDALASDMIRDRLGEVTFVTATDGNHGRGVAWTAKRLKQKAVVYMPAGSAPERLANIRAEGADASIVDTNYDGAVRLATEMAVQNGWVLLQDTAGEGCTDDILRWIMQGYTTMGYEAYARLPSKPTHIFLQAGVGSMAGAMSGYFNGVYDGTPPIITIVEPDKADCIFRTAEAGDGAIRRIGGKLDTIMAGLACGEPCAFAWDVLNGYADNFISCPDYVAAKGMRLLGNPPGNDMRVISGESGAVTVGCVAEIMTNPLYEDIRGALKLNNGSHVLCFSTEGDTDKKNYKAIVWDGKVPNPQTYLTY